MFCFGKNLRVRPVIASIFTLLIGLGIAHSAAGDAKSDADKNVREDTYRAIFQTVDSTSLRHTVTALAQNGSRVAGYPGDNVKSAAFVEQKFRSILGAAGNVEVDTFDVTIPYDPSVDEEGKAPNMGAFIDFGKQGAGDSAVVGATTRLKIDRKSVV